MHEGSGGIKSETTLPLQSRTHNDDDTRCGSSNAERQEPWTGPRFDVKFTGTSKVQIIINRSRSVKSPTADDAEGNRLAKLTLYPSDS